MTGSPVKATQRQLKALTRNRQRAKTNSQIPELKDAAKIIAALDKRLTKAEGELALMRSAYEKLMKWKMEQERRGK